MKPVKRSDLNRKGLKRKAAKRFNEQMKRTKAPNSAAAQIMRGGIRF